MTEVEWRAPTLARWRGAGSAGKRGRTLLRPGVVSAGAGCTTK